MGLWRKESLKNVQCVQRTFKMFKGSKVQCVQRTFNECSRVQKVVQCVQLVQRSSNVQDPKIYCFLETKLLHRARLRSERRFGTVNVQNVQRFKMFKTFKGSIDNIINFTTRAQGKFDSYYVLRHKFRKSRWLLSAKEDFWRIK